MGLPFPNYLYCYILLLKSRDHIQEENIIHPSRAKTTSYLPSERLLFKITSDIKKSPLFSPTLNIIFPWNTFSSYNLIYSNPFIFSIGKLLRLLGSKNKDWDEVLPSALWALRTTKNKVTKHSSFELVYGREDQQPFDIAARPTKDINKSSDEVLLEKFINHYRWTLEAAENVKNANKYWAARREEKNSLNEGKRIREGDLVLVRNFSRTKLEPYFVGPLKVIKKQFNTVTLADPNSGIQMNRNVHLKNIVKYNSASM
ncbi:hypothetical protein H8356DRAFT_1355643 [Neocallimastix lanati (nom. inval.)]|nr:hypothetical protein H8356DRAFT_1355643 [Neocallimastix sp. JGI-2020a]